MKSFSHKWWLVLPVCLLATPVMADVWKELGRIGRALDATDPKSATRELLRDIDPTPYSNSPFGPATRGGPPPREMSEEERRAGAISNGQIIFDDPRLNDPNVDLSDTVVTMEPYPEVTTNINSNGVFTLDIPEVVSNHNASPQVAAPPQAPAYGELEFTLEMPGNGSDDPSPNLSYQLLPTPKERLGMGEVAMYKNMPPERIKMQYKRGEKPTIDFYLHENAVFDLRNVQKIIVNVLKDDSFQVNIYYTNAPPQVVKLRSKHIAPPPRVPGSSPLDDANIML